MKFNGIMLLIGFYGFAYNSVALDLLTLGLSINCVNKLVYSLFVHLYCAGVLLGFLCHV